MSPLPQKSDIRSWLRSNGHSEVAASIEKLMAHWAKIGKSTRRNWWDVLAGRADGRPRRVGGIEFPVLHLRTRPRKGKRAFNVVIATPKRSVVTHQSDDDFKNTRDAAASVLSERIPRPFLKWAGGKRQLLSEISARLPDTFGTYYEPFVGGGALFFYLRPKDAILADQNKRLIRAYLGIKNSVEEVIRILQSYENTKRFYLKHRKAAIDGRSDAEVAAWFIFLNKAGFNGLYRVNSRNEFNVPYGDNKGAQICDAENLRACSKALAHTQLRHEDFATVVANAKRGDLVYFDPPYVPLSETSYFTSYTATGFDARDQRRLRDVALDLKKRGVFVILSNSSAKEVSELYSGEFECIPVFASRLVNSKASGRGKIAEMLIL